MKEKFLPGFYELPGGKVDFGENPEDGLEREYKEEVGLEIKVIKPYRVFSYISDNNNRHTVEILFIVRLINESAEIKLGKGHDDYKWVLESEIEKYKITDEIKRAIYKGFKIAK
jgi:8-oxo-dGTP diphosphatase